MQGVVWSLWGKAGSTGPAPGGLVSVFLILLSSQTLGFLYSFRMGRLRPDWNQRALSSAMLSHAGFCLYSFTACLRGS